jgi:translation initiation factor 5B
MAPKKKGNKRQDEDWEAELGESAAAPTDAPAEEQAQDGGENAEEAGGGGLMAALRKNKARKAKKGKPVNDFVEGEDAGADLASKQPEEGTFDEDDVFAGKPNKPIKEVAPPPAPAADEGEFRVKSKKEKEKERKEREKQRKKEQVWLSTISLSCVCCTRDGPRYTNL